MLERFQEEIDIESSNRTLLLRCSVTPMVHLHSKGKIFQNHAIRVVLRPYVANLYISL